MRPYPSAVGASGDGARARRSPLFGALSCRVGDRLPLSGSRLGGGLVAPAAAAAARAGLRTQRLRPDERGSVTLEVMLWLPLLVELTLISLDAFWAYWTHAEMWNVAFGAARQVASGSFDMLAIERSMQAVVGDWIAMQLGSGYGVAYSETATHHTVVVTADVERMSLFGNLFDVLEQVEARVTLAKEMQ
jgi:Flp pilus assembly protein TadG